MPYQSVKDVPDYVPEAHRKQWLEVFNSAYAAAKKDGKADKDAEESAFAQANGVVKKAKEKASEQDSGFRIQDSGLPRFVSLLASDGSDGLIRIPIAVTGSWVRGTKKFSITDETLAEIIANFQKRRNGEINVDYDHASEMPEVAAGAPIPSAGRVVKLDPPESLNGNGRKILWGHYEPTDRARQMISSREYRYISPAIDWAVQDKQTGKAQGATLTTVALTNRPFLEELPDIHLSDPAFVPVAENQQFVDVDSVHVPTSDPNFSIQARQPVEGAKPVDLKAQGTGGGKKMLKPKKIQAGEHAGKIGCYDGENLVGVMEEADMLACHPTANFSEESFSAFLTDVGIPKEAHTPDKLKAMLVAGDAAQKKAKAEGSRALLLSEVIVNGKVDAVVAANYLAAGKITAEDFKAGIAAEKRVDGAIQAGKLLPRNRGEGIRLVLSETETFEPFKSFIEEGKPLVNLNPKGVGQGSTGDASTDLRALAKMRAEEKKIPLAQALSEVSREHPDLATQHRASVTGDQ